jgi:hypothetical protein
LALDYSAEARVLLTTENGLFDSMTENGIAGIYIQEITYGKVKSQVGPGQPSVAITSNQHTAYYTPTNTTVS